MKGNWNSSLMLFWCFGGEAGASTEPFWGHAGFYRSSDKTGFTLKFYIKMFVSTLNNESLCVSTQSYIRLIFHFHHTG